MFKNNQILYMRFQCTDVYGCPKFLAMLCNLEKVLSCLEELGLKLKLFKCSFLLSSVEYLGHRISAAGIQPTEDNLTSPGSQKRYTTEIVVGVT